MKPGQLQWVVTFSMLLIFRASATVLYVDLNSTNPTLPYADWSTAATNIQDAVDASSDGDQILVTDGIYQTGGRVVYGLLTNRVVINKAVTVQSVNGPAVTTILGFPTNGDDAVRCVYLTNNATLLGFTLAFGDTRNVGNTNLEQSGGGVWCESSNAFLFNCIIASNNASQYGGGAYSGTLSNCTFVGNWAVYGGAAYAGTLNKCLINSNGINAYPGYSDGEFDGSGACNCILNNCTIAGNFAFNGAGAYNSTLNNCTFTGNIGIVCGGGAYNSTLNNCTITSNSVGQNGGGAYACVLNNCTVAGNSANNLNPYSSFNSGGGAYGGALTNCVLAGNTATYGGAVSGGARLDYCTISNNSALYGGGAAKSYNLNDVNCILNNCLLAGNVATNSGGGAYGATLSNCTICFNSVSNYSDTGPFYGGGVEQCILNNCLLISNSLSAIGSESYGYGGGADSSTLSNCTIVGNFVTSDYQQPYGGGVENSLLSHCTISGNSSTGSGGGASDSTLNYCTVTGNMAFIDGGGVGFAVATNCLFYGNSAGRSGGGATGCILVNCTVVSNSQTRSGFYYSIYGGGGGVSYSLAQNCIIYYNISVGNSNHPNYFLPYYPDSDLSSALTNCCTYPMPTNGVGNITNAPNFIDLAGGNFHLQTNSPCINVGNNAYVVGSTDLDGRSRIVGGTVDIGAYEFQGAGMGEFIAWLQQNGLPTDGSADYVDTDGDGMNNWQEWRTGTDPTDPLSLLKMASATPTSDPPGINVSWQSVSGIIYFLERGTSLTAQPAFSTIQSNIIGQTGTTSYTDTTATNGGPYFYRVGMQ